MTPDQTHAPRPGAGTVDTRGAGQSCRQTSNRCGEVPRKARGREERSLPLTSRNKPRGDCDAVYVHP
jgi:hypothetical protein